MAAGPAAYNFWMRGSPWSKVPPGCPRIKSSNPMGDARSASRSRRAVWVIAPSQFLR